MYRVNIKHWIHTAFYFYFIQVYKVFSNKNKYFTVLLLSQINVLGADESLEDLKI